VPKHVVLYAVILYISVPSNKVVLDKYIHSNLVKVWYV